jgi:Zn-finger nucleic acid-binding protein
MSSPVICLGCGGMVDEGEGLPAGEVACSCPPPSLEAREVKCPSCGGSLRVGARACPYCRSTLATTRCQACFAWNLADAQHCQACGRGLAAAPGDAAAKNLGCPRCTGSLSARRYHELEVDECDACGGLLLSASMMDRIVASRDGASGLRLALPSRPQSRETAVRYILCPVCSKSMNREAFGRISGVVVDVCREHGVWFDPGELAEVLSFIERGGLTRARERERLELEEAARSLRTARAVSPIGSLSQAGALAQAGGSRGNTSLELDFLRSLWDLWR